MHYRREEITPRVLKKLARGEYAAQEELDLHGLPRAGRRGAAARVPARLPRRTAWAACGSCTARAATREERLPVLKNLVDRMLRQRADVLAFHSPPPAQGGTGAVLVLLEKR